MRNLIENILTRKKILDCYTVEAMRTDGSMVKFRHKKLSSWRFIFDVRDGNINHTLNPMLAGNVGDSGSGSLYYYKFECNGNHWQVILHKSTQSIASDLMFLSQWFTKKLDKR